MWGHVFFWDSFLQFLPSFITCIFSFLTGRIASESVTLLKIYEFLPLISLYCSLRVNNSYFSKKGIFWLDWKKGEEEKESTKQLWDAAAREGGRSRKGLTDRLRRERTPPDSVHGRLRPIAPFTSTLLTDARFFFFLIERVYPHVYLMEKRCSSPDISKQNQHRRSSIMHTQDNHCKSFIFVA